MPPSFEDQALALHLAYIGSLNDDILDMDDVALELLREIAQTYPSFLTERYGITDFSAPLAMYEEVRRRRGFMLRGESSTTGAARRRSSTISAKAASAASPSTTRRRQAMDKADKLFFEREMLAVGAQYIAGADEVGRGRSPPRGVRGGDHALGRGELIEGIDDSKKLKEGSAPASPR